MDLNKFDYIFEQVDLNRLDLSDSAFAWKIFENVKGGVNSSSKVKAWISNEKIKYKNQKDFSESFNKNFDVLYESLPIEARDFNYKKEGIGSLESLRSKLFINKKHRLNLIEEYSFFQRFILGMDLEFDEEGFIFIHPEIGPFFSFPFLYGFSVALGYSRSPESWNNSGKKIFGSKLRCSVNLIHKPFMRLYYSEKYNIMFQKYKNHENLIENTYKVADIFHKFVTDLENTKEVA